MGACSTGNGTTPGNTTPNTSGGATSEAGSSGTSGSTTVTSGGASSGGATTTTGGSTGTTGTGGATTTTGGSASTKGGTTGAGGTMGSSGPPPSIGGFAVTIPPGALTMTDPTCGVQSFKRERKPTEIILVLDRSASMKEKPKDATTATSKWDIVKPAIVGAVTATNTALSWGLKLYPEGTGTTCGASIVPLIHVPVAPNNAPTVVAAINATTPEGDGTPTGDAIKFATDHLKARGNDNPKFILLATDGDPSCPSGDSAITYAVTNIAAALTAGFPTFVVGIDTKSSAERLNLMAAAGGRPRPITGTNTTAFYLASTQAELTAALQEITGAVASCVFELTPPPPVPDNIAVDFNGMRAPHDPTKMNGWEYTSADHTSLEVYGAFCDSIKKQSMNQVEIKYGCPGVPIPLPG